jgi:hypothetical protein
MRKKMMLATLAALLLSSCAGYVPPRYDPALYPHCYRGYDLALAWKTGREEGNLTVEGFIRNNRHSYLHGLELTVTLLDEKGKEPSTATFFFIPDLIQPDEIKPFDVKLRIPPDAVPLLLKFRYLYHLRGEGGVYGTPYFYDFEADL